MNMYYHVIKDSNNKAALQNGLYDTNVKHAVFDIPSTKYEIIINVDGVLHSSFKGNTLEHIPELIYTTLNNLKDADN